MEQSSEDAQSHLKKLFLKTVLLRRFAASSQRLSLAFASANVFEAVLRNID